MLEMALAMVCNRAVICRAFSWDTILIESIASASCSPETPMRAPVARARSRKASGSGASVRNWPAVTRPKRCSLTLTGALAYWMPAWQT